MAVVLSSAAAMSSDTAAATFAFDAPKGITATDVFTLIAPGEDQHLATLIALQKWPARENTYVGMVCLAPDKESYDEDKGYCNGGSCCRAGYGGFDDARHPRRVFLAVVEYDQRLTLIASFGGPLNVMTNWQQSNIAPNESVKDESVYPGIYQGFDFAPYKISKDQTAFGIRVAWETMYAGGGGMFDALMLFLIQGDRIVNVLSEPIEEWGMSGGAVGPKNEWQTKNVLRILPNEHSGYFDIQLKQRGGKWKKTFRWDAESRRYLPLRR